ncbi:porphobilinogen synthase [Abditibacterium utsteinense]|uniref:Delta-aminolevulinic acid dehydratase n=1 Tax=Abditibacterium utsteinense TaxID=1960156 RepID=A0A2S8SRP7_9BACT|nr:porphobilinogen synthase [Abditibacterium utsteinense]PQV63470.1 porphobilinogen synthase [Abditibacterium utsteinense]
MAFPIQRARRLRQNSTLRAMMRENHVRPTDLIAPLFIQNGENIRLPIESLPGQNRLSPDTAALEAKELWDLGVPSVMLFGIPDFKDAIATSSYDPNGPVPRALQKIKEAVPEMQVICDVCACEYTDHGHCGILHGESVDNDKTLELLGRVAVAYARAGCDLVAPSDMMDGRVMKIRAALDGAGFSNVPILSYAAKFAGAFYGPFRDAAGSAPSFGDRRTYQMDIANRREALREMALDVEEGADALIIKPGLFCLDLLRDARENFNLPLCVYNVSSEYAMIKAAGQMGWINEKQLIDEALISFKRAGADLIITYHAKEWAQNL